MMRALLVGALATAAVLLVLWSLRPPNASKEKKWPKKTEPEKPSLLRGEPAESAALWARLLAFVPRREALAERIAEMGYVGGAARFTRSSLLHAFALGTAFALLGPGVWGVLVGFPLGLYFPYLRLRRRHAKRIAKFEEAFPDSIDLLTRALRAGNPLSAGLKMVADEAPEPVSTEFRRVFEEQKYGMPLADSLYSLMERIPSVDLRIFVTAVLVQRDVGGNLAEILQSISGTIRERFAIRRQVSVYTAQGRMTGYLLTGLPPSVGVVIHFLEPGYIDLLFTHPIGRVLLMGAVFLQVVGFLLIRKIVDIDV